MIELTPSQKQAIEQQKARNLLVFPAAQFQLWQPKNTKKVRLILTVKLPNLLGKGHYLHSVVYEIGAHGKVTCVDK